MKYKKLSDIPLHQRRAAFYRMTEADHLNKGDGYWCHLGPDDELATEEQVDCVDRLRLLGNIHLRLKAIKNNVQALEKLVKEAYE
jgi:hypothetical protein